MAETDPKAAAREAAIQFREKHIAFCDGCHGKTLAHKYREFVADLDALILAQRAAVWREAERIARNLPGWGSMGSEATARTIADKCAAKAKEERE